MAGKAFFFQRMNDHVQYLKKIQATLDGKGDFQGTDFQECKLGKWLYDEGPEEASAISAETKSLFDTLLEPHQRFHDASHEALQKHRDGDSEGAKDAVTEMLKLSNVLINILLELDKLSN
ncbi:MAG: CZB domain-containing protein [Pseudomonadota bacterium]